MVAEPAVDIRLAASSLLRHRGTLTGAAVVGALLGIVWVILWPPMYASSSLVLLPPKAADPNQMAELVKTDIRIAMSDSVLGPAAESLRPSMSVEELERHVDVTAATSLVLDVQGRAEQPQIAEDISLAVANANVSYVAQSLSSLSNARRSVLADRENELRSTVEKLEKQIQATTARLRGEDPQSPRGEADATALARLTAQQGKVILQIQQIQDQLEGVQPSGGASVIQQPSPAERPGLIARSLGATLLGALVATLLTAGVIILLTRRDPMLYFRDDIADAVGSPVVASVHTRATTSVAEWISLLQDYAPGSVDAWAWRRALRDVGFGEFPGVAEDRNASRGKHPRTILVITLSADLRGLAVGPELAAYAASTGVRTRLVASQQHQSAAALWAACSRLEQEHEVRPGLSVSSRQDPERKDDLTIHLAVLNRRAPKLLDVPADGVVLLALSAGSATAEELARAAVTVDDAGERIHGVVVADPDSLDRTTGRLLQHERLRQPPLPVRLSGYVAPRAPRDTASESQRRQG